MLQENCVCAELLALRMAGLYSQRSNASYMASKIKGNACQ